MNTVLKKARWLVVLAVMLILAVVFSAADIHAATADGHVTKAYNYSDGVKVKWQKASKQSGYYIYKRQSGYTKWHKVKTIKGASTTSWVDTDVTNGTGYEYKVYAYKGSKKCTNSKVKKVYYLTRAKITSLSSSKSGTFDIKSKSNSKASGYVVEYATKSDFSNKKKIEPVWDKVTLDRTIMNLSCAKKYYVRIKSFRTVHGEREYSAYSPAKTVTTKAGQTAYTINASTRIYTSTAWKNDTSKKLAYNQKVKLGAYVSISDKGTARKITFNGKTYYAWIKKGDTLFTTKAPNTKYIKDTNTALQNEVLAFALDIYNNKTTKYDFDHKHNYLKESAPSNGVYYFDCSGFVSYVLNSVMQKHAPAYKTTAHLMSLYEMDCTYNRGLTGEAKVKDIIKKGEPYDESKLKPGDVLFFKSADGYVKGDDRISNHCAIYLGNGAFIQSTKVEWDGNDKMNGNGVCISTVNEAYLEGFIKATRYIPATITPANLKVTTVKNKYIYVYSKPNAVAENSTGDKVPYESEVNILYTSQLKEDGKWQSPYSYIEYKDEKGTKKKGWIQTDTTKLVGFPSGIIH